MSRRTRGQWLKERWILAAILAVYLTIGLAYNGIVPAFETPDEPAHFSYVHYLVTHRRFPVQQPDPELSPTLEAHQPPLYYVLSAALTAWIDQAGLDFSLPNPCIQWSPDLPGQRYVYLHGQDERFPYRDGWLALHIVRALSLVLGGVTIWATYRLGRIVFADHAFLALTAAALAALNPQFLFMHSAANNDNLATALSALILLVAARAVETRPKWGQAALLGLLLGLGALTKYNVFALTPVALVGALLPPLREQRWGQAGVHLACLLLIPVLVAGWWYARNLRIYDDPWAWRVALAAHPHDVRVGPLTWADVGLFAHRVFNSFWGFFGWLTVRLGMGYYIGAALATGAGLVGLSLAGLGHKFRVSRSLLIVLLAALSVAASLGRYILTYNHTAYQGRLLFPALPAIALLLAFGWARLLGMRRLGWLFLAVVAAGLVMNAIGLYAILRAYPRPEIYETASLAHLASPCLVLDERAQLLAYEVSPPIARSGGSVALALYWYGLVDRPGDSALSVDMLGRNDELLAHAAAVPSLRHNRISKDVILLETGATLLPTKGRLQLRLLDGAGSALPVVTRNRHPAGAVIELSPIKVVPVQPLAYGPTETVGARYGEAITLLGYDLSAGHVAPGGVLDLTLYWGVESPPAADYTVFVHLMDETGTPVAQGDSPPDKGNYPTTLWGAGEQIRDWHGIAVPSDTLPGRYRLGVGMYLPETGERLEAFDARGEPLAAGAVVLSEIVVTRQ